MTEYRACARCVMDTTADDIQFAADGTCNYCAEFLARLQAARTELDRNPHRFDELVARIKAHARSKEYDCVMGVSGGVDSSYALYRAVKAGLRPLAVHLDNGWNSELASHNIANLVSTLGV